MRAIHKITLEKGQLIVKMLIRISTKFGSKHKISILLPLFNNILEVLVNEAKQGK